MAKPKMAMIPSTVGGSVYSVLPSNGDGDFNFSRASAATRINAQGLIETVAATDNRLNYPLLDGTVQTCPHLLLEGQRTNLITYSESFSNAYWTKSGSTITSDAAISPDGTLNADKLVEDMSNGTHELEVTGLAVVADKYTISLFAKASERGKIQIKLRNYFAGDPNVIFDLENGTFQQNAQAIGSMTLLSNGFYKCTFTTVLNAIAGGNAILNINLVDEANQTSYQGDGTSGIYIYGAQLEQGSYPTSYIVSNSGSATTRIAEVCDGSGNASTFNDSEGVLMAQIGALADDGTERFISISDGTVNNRIYIWYYSVTNGLAFAVFNGGAAQFFSTTVLNSDVANNKLALKYKANDFAMWINGFEIASDISGTAFGAGVLNELAFDNGAGASPFYGKTKQLQYFDSALTDSELETLTSWMSFSDMAIDLNYTIQ
jgi:hypothetical protein